MTGSRNLFWYTCLCYVYWWKILYYVYCK